MNTQSLKDQFKNISHNFENEASLQNKKDSFENYLNLGDPKSSLEDWRYSNLRSMNSREFVNYSKELNSPQNLFKHNFDFPVNNIVFRNGVFDKQLSQISREVIDIIEFKGPGEFATPLRELSQFESNAFYNLNLSFNIETFYLNIPDNYFLIEPIVFNFLYESDLPDEMFHPQIEIIAGKKSQVKLIEYHQLANQNESSLINNFTRFLVDEDSNIKYVRVANFKGSTVHHMGHVTVELNDNAHFDLTSVNIGGAFNRLDGEFFHKGERSRLNLNGLCYSKNKEQVNYLTRVFHEKGFGESHQLYKGVLADESVSSFDGLMYIAPKAQKVNSSQMNKNLLLSDKAQVFTKPQLDINADDVKAAHGATVSELSDDEIFYLMSRGINKLDAKKIMQRAFVDEVLLKIGDINIQNWLKKEVG